MQSEFDMEVRYSEVQIYWRERETDKLRNYVSDRSSVFPQTFHKDPYYCILFIFYTVIKNIIIKKSKENIIL